MKELLASIVSSLVEHPEAISIAEHEKENDHILFELRVAESDMGKVIGKQGRIAKAIRTVMKAAATGENKKVTVDILEPEE